MKERSIFLSALERTPPERAAYLDQACDGDLSLRRRVEALLDAHDREPGLVDALAAVNERTPTIVPDDHGSPSGTGDDQDVLSFLGPSSAPDCLGVIGPYEVTEVIGRGGMGLVFRARDPRLLRIVAVKVLAPEIASNKAAKKRFEREAQAAAAVSNDHIVTIHAVDEHNGLPFLVMECIVGRTLQQKIEESGPLELKEILRIGMQTALGLAAAHKQGLVHRDIKPANILLQNGIQRVKISDFGLARAVDDVGMTHTGQIAGTPLYMSPEQAEGLRVDHLSDLFSLGSVLYTMCTGRPAFRAPSTVAVLRRIVDDSPRPIRDVNPDLPSWLAEIVNKLLSKEKSDRYQSAAEVADLLSQRLSRLQEPKSTSSGVKKPSSPVASPSTSSDQERKPRNRSTSGAAIATGRQDEHDEEPLEPVSGRRGGKPERRLTWWRQMRKASPLAWMVGAVLVPGMIALIVMMSLLLNRDRLEVRIELDDLLRQQDVTVILDQASYAARDLGPSIRITPGVHTLEVHRGAEQFKSEPFTVSQDERPVFRVKDVGGRFSVERVDAGSTPLQLADRSDPPVRRFVRWALGRGGIVEKPGGGRITSADDFPAGGIPNLIDFTATPEPLRDEDIERFADLAGVENAIIFRKQSITTSGIARLGQLMSGRPVSNLQLVDMPISLSALKEPGGFSHLRTLVALNTKTTDEDLACLIPLKQLVELQLRTNRGITDQGLAHLLQLKSLKILSLEGTGLSEPSLARLREALPGCQIGPAAATPVSPRKPLAFLSPEFARWTQDVASMPVGRQADAVGKKLVELNPAFDGQIAPALQGNEVVGVQFVATYVRDISPVRAFPGLKSLDCRGQATKSELRDLAPLAGLPLTELKLQGTSVSDLSPLQGMQLKVLDCGYTPVSDLSPLKGMPLQELNCWHSAVSDFSPLNPETLTTLTFNRTGVPDLKGLRGFKLKSIGFTAMNISDLSPLQGMPLESVDCAINPVSDLSPLAGMKLKYVNCGGTMISSLVPLKDSELTSLICADTLITDLSPLQGKKLTSLYCGNTKVSSLSPLVGMPLVELFCKGAPITDYSPLAGLPLLRLELDFDPDRDTELLRSLKSLVAVNGKLMADFWKDVEKR